MSLEKKDSQSQKVSYRITVRQLESLIRLSEALVRVHLDNQINEDYVLEAHRLLSKSIINVEEKDIELDGFEDKISVLKASKAMLDAEKDEKEQVIPNKYYYYRKKRLLIR